MNDMQYKTSLYASAGPEEPGSPDDSSTDKDTYCTNRMTSTLVSVSWSLNSPQKLQKEFYTCNHLLMVMLIIFPGPVQKFCNLYIPSTALYQSALYYSSSVTQHQHTTSGMPYYLLPTISFSSISAVSRWRVFLLF